MGGYVVGGHGLWKQSRSSDEGAEEEGQVGEREMKEPAGAGIAAVLGLRNTAARQRNQAPTTAAAPP